MCTHLEAAGLSRTIGAWSKRNVMGGFRLGVTRSRRGLPLVLFGQQSFKSLHPCLSDTTSSVRSTDYNFTPEDILPLTLLPPPMLEGYTVEEGRRLWERSASSSSLTYTKQNNNKKVTGPWASHADRSRGALDQTWSFKMNQDVWRKNSIGSLD